MLDSELHQQLVQSNEKLAKRKSCWYGLVYGVAVGLGVTIGSTVVIWVIIFILQKMQILPGINTEQLEGLIKILESQNDYFQK